MLPCNVLVYENKGGVFVSAILPTVAMNSVGNQRLRLIAMQIEVKLKSAVDNSS